MMNSMESIKCPLCNETHEVTRVGETRLVGCPRVPEHMVFDLDAFKPRCAMCLHPSGEHETRLSEDGETLTSICPVGVPLVCKHPALVVKIGLDD